MPTADPDLGSTLEQHRREIHVHCYRMTGSFSDAEDLTQETFLRAWRHRDRFEGRASVRTWLYRIATNACLDFAKRHDRRSLPSGSIIDTLELDAAIQPFPDTGGAGWARSGDPADAVVESETTGLLLLATLLHLPPRQRATLIARDLLAFSAEETSALLDCSTTSVNSLLQRARRATRSLSTPRSPAPPTPESEAIVARYIDAHHRADVDALLELVAADVRISMPPEPPCHGAAQARSFFAHVLSARRTGAWRVVPVRANGRPATANYLRRPGDTAFQATSIDVLDVDGDRIEMISCFLDHHLFAAFGLPPTWDR
jgi:RNA polymerase sigma-70 factor (ECF subfamily)